MFQPKKALLEYRILWLIVRVRISRTNLQMTFKNLSIYMLGLHNVAHSHGKQVTNRPLIYIQPNEPRCDASWVRLCAHSDS